MPLHLEVPAKLDEKTTAELVAELEKRTKQAEHEAQLALAERA